ncbi:hypothetical protein J4E85_009996 [Alternaria conjuncta]|uniref:uncharacterized protein n=1 Tax=Alternaria conjuncta TaxID=181017 RepID=UPI002220F3FE|nr:uncharacterized protein J4E85_009996 [Alternaria conjuncta]KAI4917477.1 hypothetical protein J4E85_009996 [Alternaria conjuncta]
MATNVGSSRGSSRGRTSFLDLPGELRNKIYDYFLNLKPSITKAANLACVTHIVHAEFTTLFIRRWQCKSETFHFESIHEVLHSFFVQYPNSAPKNVRYVFCVGIEAGTIYPVGPEDDNPVCTLDLLKVVSVLRLYPLIHIHWDLVNRNKDAVLEDGEVAYAVYALEEMSDHQLEKLDSAKLDLWYNFSYAWGRHEVHANLDLRFKKGATKKDVKTISASQIRTEHQGIIVGIEWERNSWGKDVCGGFPKDLSSSSEEDDSDSGEENSDSGEDNSDSGGVDPESEDQILCL